MSTENSRAFWGRRQAMPIDRAGLVGENASGERLRRPRVLLAPTGTLGDVYPFIAVAKELDSIGCDVLLATMENYRAEVEAAGVAFRPVRPGRSEFEADGHDDASVARAVARDLRAGIALSAPHIRSTFEDLCAAAVDRDVVVGGPLSSVARVVGEAAGVPIVTLVLQPMGFLSFSEPPRMGEAPLLHLMGRYVSRPVVAAVYYAASWRGRSQLRSLHSLRRQLELPLVRDELRAGPRRSDRMIAMYPSSFCPLPDDAPRNAVSAGFALYDGASSRLTPALLRFLDAGPPPLIFTLGSFVIHAAGDFYRTAVAVARELGRRAVLLVGDHAIEEYAAIEGRDILVQGHASHSGLFARAECVIHHGGIGTAAQALAAGLPQLVCPFFGDQFDNADHLRRLGVSATLPLAHFDAPKAIAQLSLLLASQEVKMRARRVAGTTTSSSGVARAALEIAEAARRGSLHRGRAGAPAPGADWSHRHPRASWSRFL